jgi:hypothetical protein
MTRAQRALHAGIWPLLAVLVAIGFATALYFRAPAPPESETPTEAQP